MENEIEDPLLLGRDRTPSNSSDADVAYQSGNYEISTDEPVNVTSTSGQTESERRQQRWNLNYHEAAIYLQEGENNDKFSSHPRSQNAIPAYLITHNTWFYMLDLFASVLILALAVIENPAVFEVPIGVHGSLELMALLIIALELGMRMKWLGHKAFFTHIRTLLKVVTLLFMVAESITVLARQSSHFRVTRALRPIFLLDSFYLRDVRRFIRQVGQSLQPIFDMLILLIFFMLLFSILGFYLFATIPNDTPKCGFSSVRGDGGGRGCSTSTIPEHRKRKTAGTQRYFNTIQDSFVSLFVLLTTANFPDVMLPAYAKTPWSAIFFIMYLSLELYFLMNLFLAVVYDAFVKIEKDKLRKLLVHKRFACQFAFKLLVSRQNPNKMSLRHFEGLMKFLKPSMSRRDCYLSFKCLNKSRSGMLSKEEFYEVYEVCALKWKQQRSCTIWSDHFRHPFDKIFKALHWFVTHKWFDYFVYFVICANFAWIFADTIQISIIKAESTDMDEWIRTEYSYLWISVTFVAIYLFECALKILGLGPRRYFSSGWNIFDFCVTMLAAIGIGFQLINQGFYYMLVLRPFRLLRLFKLKKRFRDVLGTLFILLPRMVSIAIVILILYYFFGIIGMELFSSYDMRNCCVNTSVEVFFRYNNVTNEYGYYYLNNFDNILKSGVTLFELTVVNNWYIIMDGYASMISDWTRIYFMVFYICLMVVMTIVVAFVLEAFLFRIQYRDRMQGHDCDDDAVMRMELSLTPEEVQMCVNKTSQLAILYLGQAASSINNGSGTSEGLQEGSRFKGERLRGKDDFNLKMYRDEVQEWLSEEENRQRERVAEMQEITTESENRVLVETRGDDETDDVARRNITV